MKIVRRPRVSTEFEKMMRSNDPVKLLKMMKEIGVIFKVLPELCHLYRIKDHSLREQLGPNAALPTLWDVTMERLEEVVGSPEDSLEARFAALFSQFHRVKLPYSYSDRKDRTDKEKRRGKGRNAVVATALRRLMYDYDFIRAVKKLLPEKGEGKELQIEVPPARKKKKKTSKDTTSVPTAKKRKRRSRRKKKKSDGAE